MSEQSRTLLVGGIPLGIGYLDAMLQQHNIPVHSFILNVDLPFHSDIFNTEIAKQILIQCLQEKRYIQTTTHIIENLGGLSALKNITALELCSIFNQLLKSEIYKYSIFKNNLLLHQYIGSKNLAAANKEALRYMYPEIFTSLDNNEFYQIRNEIILFAPAIIGFQLLIHTRERVFQLIEKIHQAFPHLYIVLGGICATGLYREILAKYPYLIIVLGEGEHTVLELIQAIEKKQKLCEVSGIAFVEETAILKTKKRELIHDLDKIPIPNHNLSCFVGERYNALWILTSRGCSFNCTFCSNKLIYKKQLRYRSIKNVIAELEYIKNNFTKVKNILITDDLFLTNQNRILEFCDEVIKRKLHFRFSCFGRIWPLSIQMIKKMEAAGFDSLEFGIDTTNTSILKNVNKRLTPEDILNGIKLLSASKIAVRSHFIIGLPGETWQTIREMALFIQKLQRIKYMFLDTPHIAVAFPGTTLYEEMLEQGLLSENSWIQQKNKLFYYTKEHREDVLFKMQEELASYICINRFFTIKGFSKQWHMLFLSRNKRVILSYLYLRVYHFFIRLFTPFYEHNLKYEQTK